MSASKQVFEQTLLLVVGVPHTGHSLKSLSYAGLS